MQARRASRELALILFSQFEKEITHYSRNDFENIMLNWAPFIHQKYQVFSIKSINFFP